SILRWINAYRDKPDPAGVPAVVQALSRFGAFRDPEQAGVYVGFVPGVIPTNPGKAQARVVQKLPPPRSDQWVGVAALAYSHQPDWRNIMRRSSQRLSARKVMIDKYLSGELPRLYEFAPEPTVSAWDQISNKFNGKEPPKAHVLEPGPELLDTYWGYY